MSQKTEQNLIKYFIWKWQHTYAISVQVAAERIFRKLDENLAPKCFLIGIRSDASNSSHPICIEPEDDCEYPVSHFLDVKKIAEHLEAIDDETHIFHSHPQAQKNHDRRIKAKNLATAVEKVLNRNGEYNEYTSFCSWPSSINNYEVCVVLQLNQKAYKSHYSLLNDTVDGRYRVATSLLDATTAEFLRGCTRSLREQDAGEDFNALDTERNNYLRAAGRLLMRTPDERVSRGLASLFDDCCNIASLRYESKEGTGKIILAEKGHPNVQLDIEFKTPVQFHKHRTVRKLLEMTSDDLCLLSNAEFIFGLGKQINSYDQHNEDLFHINFIGQHKWELWHDSQPMMTVDLGEPNLPTKPIDEKKFKTDVGRLFNQIRADQVDLLWKLSTSAAQQKHGALLVVSDRAKDEAERLSGQSLQVEPTLLTENKIPMLTAIDGAVLIGPDGVCFAIGVILDGLASRNGTPERGARFNSAIRYVETMKEQHNSQCLAIIVSEDGTIDLTPNLMPQISRSSIIEKLSSLREITERQDINVKQYNRVMEWFSAKQFYLSSENCQELNTIKHSTDKSLMAAGNMVICRDDFKPSSEMNDSYFDD